MGRTHSKMIMDLFPNIKPIGIDLGNLEFKECDNKDNVFTISKKDMEAEYIVSYNHNNQFWLITPTYEFPNFPKRKNKVSKEYLNSLSEGLRKKYSNPSRTFSFNILSIMSYFKSDDNIKLIDELLEIINDDSLLLDIPEIKVEIEEHDY